jgi:hypothetical protein
VKDRNAVRAAADKLMQQDKVLVAVKERVFLAQEAPAKALCTVVFAGMYTVHIVDGCHL